MEYRDFGKAGFKVSAIGLGTWVTGGWLWGGSDEKESALAVEAALEAGITLIDTAPVYGFGRSESIVGSVISRLKIRSRVVLATKCGLEWDEKGRIRRNSRPERILREIDDSRRRLQSDVIDIYQIHWPDESVPPGRSMEVLHRLLEQGTIRAIGVSNFSVSRMRECMKAAPLHSLQPPYNLYEREIEEEILPFCRENGIAVLGYGALCRGLLSGKFRERPAFPPDDIRSMDPKFSPENFPRYLAANRRLEELARRKKTTLACLAIRWAASQSGMTSALAGARNPAQAAVNAAAFDFEFTQADAAEIEAALAEEKLPPLSPAFMAPPPSAGA